MKLDYEFLEEFKKGKIAVNCETKEEAISFCKWMHNCGLRWASGDSYTEMNNWNACKEGTCYTGAGEFAREEYYSKEGYVIIKYKDLINPIDLSKYQTEDKDFTGCNPIVAEALKQGKTIKCHVRDHVSEDFQTQKVRDYCVEDRYPYVVTDSKVYRYAVPLPKLVKYYKKASAIMKWLEDNGYVPSLVEHGYWLHDTKTDFCAEMFQYCGKEVPEKMHWIWLPEWIEEK